MGYLEGLRAKLEETRQHTATHPLAPHVTMTFRAPEPDDNARARRHADGDSRDEQAVSRMAGLLADCLVSISENGQTVATLAGRDLAEHLGMPWRARDGDDPGTTAAEVIRRLYGPCWMALLDDGDAVLRLAGRGPDPSS